MSAVEKQKLWRQHIQAWQSSSLTQKAYCQQHELSLSSFGYWRKRVNSEDVPIVLPVLRDTALTGLHFRSSTRWQMLLPTNMSLESMRMIQSLLL